MPLEMFIHVHTRATIEYGQIVWKGVEGGTIGIATRSASICIAARCTYSVYNREHGPYKTYIRLISDATECLHDNLKEESTQRQIWLMSKLQW